MQLMNMHKIQHINVEFFIISNKDKGIYSIRYNLNKTNIGSKRSELEAKVIECLEFKN